MRPLFMDFPDDPQVADLRDEYMFGPAFLVAPVTEQGATSRAVYLPAGSDWYNYWTNERVQGGQTHPGKRAYRCAAAVRSRRLHCSDRRSGRQHRAAAEDRKGKGLSGRDADFTLFDDDGTTYGYEQGDSKITRLHWDDAARTVSPTQALKPGAGPDDQMR